MDAECIVNLNVKCIFYRALVEKSRTSLDPDKAKIIIPCFVKKEMPIFSQAIINKLKVKMFMI